MSSPSRSKSIIVRVTQSEYSDLLHSAKLCGLSMSSYVRNVLTSRRHTATDMAVQSLRTQVADLHQRLSGDIASCQ